MKKEKKRLCILVLNHWSEIMGGSPYESKILIETLNKTEQYEIFYITRRCVDGYPTEGYSLVKISHGDGKRRFGEFVDAGKLLKILRDLKPHIIYQLVAGAYTGIAAYYCKHNDCNMVWRVQHDRDVSPPGWNFSRIPFCNYIDNKILDYGIKNANKIVAQSEVQNELLNKYYDRKATAIIPNFHPNPKEDINKTLPIKIAWVANLKEWKRPEIFIELARDLQTFEDVEFIMCGRPMKKNFAELKPKIDATKNLTYLGECSQDQVNKLLADSHIFVNTSRDEGFPHTYMQSWMRKTPVISLDVNPDGIFDKGNLGYFAQGSYEQMRDHVIELIKNHELRNEIGASAQEYAFANFSADAQVKRLVEIFES